MANASPSVNSDPDTATGVDLPAGKPGRAVRFIQRGLIGLVVLIVIEAILTLFFFSLLSANHRTLTHEALPAMERAKDLARLVRQLENEARALFSTSEPFAIESRLYQVDILTRTLKDSIDKIPASGKLATRKGEIAAILENWKTLLERINEVQRDQISTYEHWLNRTRRLTDLQQRIERQNLPNDVRSQALEATGLMIAANAAQDTTEIKALSAQFNLLLPKIKANVNDPVLRRALLDGAEIFHERTERFRQELHLQHLGERLVLLDRLVEAVESIADDLGRETQAQAIAAEVRLHWMTWILLLIVIVGIVMAVIGFILVNRRILERLMKLQQVMQSHVRGTPAAIPTKGEDEIADMARSFEHFVGKVKRREAKLEESIVHLNSARASLVEAEKLASLGSLVAVIAHELNTPLGSAITTVSSVSNRVDEMIVQLNSNQPISKSSLIKTLEYIATGSQLAESNLARAAKLVQSFKSVAVDQQNSERLRFNPVKIINDVVAMTKPGLLAAGHSLKLELQALPEADGYPGALEQAIMQLIENARHHAFASISSGELVLRCQTLSPEQFQIELQDNGCGIPAKLLPRIFEPFFTTKMNQGTGLGLHIVHNIVRGLYGGDIQIDSKVGKGTCFRLILPFTAPVRPAHTTDPAL